MFSWKATHIRLILVKQSCNQKFSAALKINQSMVITSLNRGAYKQRQAGETLASIQQDVNLAASPTAPN